MPIQLSKKVKQIFSKIDAWVNIAKSPHSNFAEMCKKCGHVVETIHNDDKVYCAECGADLT